MNTVADETVVEMQTLFAKPMPSEDTLQARAQRWLTMVESMPVETQDDYNLAAGELRSVKEAWKQMEAERTSWTDPLNALLRRFNGKFQPRLKLLEQAETTLKAKMVAFVRKQEALAEEQRRKAEEAAAAERKRLEAEAEAARKRAEEEAAALLASSKGKKAAAAAQKVLDQAEEQAAALQAEAAVVTAMPVMTSAPVLGAGISTSKTLDFKVEDQLALMRFIVEKRQDLVVLLAVDAAKMRAQVKLHGLKTALPGVRVFEKSGMRVR